MLEPDPSQPIKPKTLGSENTAPAIWEKFPKEELAEPREQEELRCVQSCLKGRTENVREETID